MERSGYVDVIQAPISIMYQFTKSEQGMSLTNGEKKTDINSMNGGTL
jgi:hypothetical protein